MDKIYRNLVLQSSALTSARMRMIVFALAIALFVLAAGAPNATIGIGK